jgi:amidase
MAIKKTKLIFAYPFCGNITIVTFIMDYQSIAAEKRLQRTNRIPNDWLIPTEMVCDAKNLMTVPVTCGILNDTECKITSDCDATALIEKLKAGIWSAEQVTVAFCKRAAIAHQLVSCPSSSCWITVN